jgi:hypothetical protein
MIPVNSIAIPLRFATICADWNTGPASVLRRIMETGKLATGNRAIPIADFTDHADRMRKWYLTLWRELAVEVHVAVVNSYDHIDHATLLAFEGFVDSQVAQLESSYQLASWSEP